MTPPNVATDRLYTLLLGAWTPKRASRMTRRGETAHKYIDIRDYSFSRSHLADHLAGRETYAITLGLLGEARAGCKDYDSAGEAEIIRAQDAATARGIVTAAFLMKNDAGGHTGGHLWTLYDAPYRETDIRAQLRTIPRTGKGEDYPSGNPIRVPFGYHKVKRTRGVLRLPSGRRFDLDDPAQLAAGVDAFLALPLNGRPEPAPLGDARASGAAWGDAYKIEHWTDLPDGGPLWRSPYIAAAAERRSDLAKLLRGERVTLVKKDDTRDDSDSAQVAALAWNLSSANVCEPQARAIADYLYVQLRPGRTRSHYRAHFDAEWQRYCPAHYTPQTIRILGPADGAAPRPLPPAEHRPPLKSRARKDRPQKVHGAAGYLAWLRTQVDPQSGSVMLSQTQCAERLGCCVRTIKRYEKQLAGQIERRIFARRQAGCLFILAPDVVTTSVADVVIADADGAQQHAENAEAATVPVEHTPPLPPGPAAPAELRRYLAAALDALADAGARVTFARVRKFVLSDADGRAVDLAALLAIYRVELERRRWARQDAREAAKARELSRKALARTSRAVAGQAADMRRRGDKRAPIWARRAGIYAAEEARRDAKAAERAESEAEQRALLELAGDALLDLRRRQTGRAARVCSPLPAPAGAAAIDLVPAPVDVIARLKEGRDRRQHQEASYA